MMTSRSTAALGITALLASAGAPVSSAIAEEAAAGTLTVILNELPEFAGSVECTLTDDNDMKVSDNVKLSWQAGEVSASSTVSYEVRPGVDGYYVLECDGELTEGIDVSEDRAQVVFPWRAPGVYGQVSGLTDERSSVEIRYYRADDDKVSFATQGVRGIYRAPMPPGVGSGEYVGAVAMSDAITPYAAGYIDGTTQAKAGARVPTVSLSQDQALNREVKVVVGGKATGTVIGEDGAPAAGWIVRAEPVKEGLASRLARTGENGAFTMTGLDDTEYRISAGAPDEVLAGVDWTYLGNVKDKNKSRTVNGKIGSAVEAGVIDLTKVREAPQEPPADPKTEAPADPTGSPSAPVPPTKTGWVKSGANWNYIDPATGKKVTGWKHDGKAWYYMDAAGIMKTGWVSDRGAWYYLRSGGAMATGWVNDRGTWYYLRSSGAMATGWVNDRGTWYYLRSSGAMATGWINDGKGRYYLNSSGAWVR